MLSRPAAFALLLSASLPASGAALAQDDSGIETVTVTGDRAGLIDLSPDQTAFGLDKPLGETPRAITAISDTTLDRYGVTGVDTLSAIAPSAYTASYYGVEGSVNLRGTLAENYFRGFKRAENRGTYETPLGDAAQLEILRGPPSPLYGAGKVGGLLNFVPKSAGADDAPGGQATLTYGSYSKRNLSLEGNLPLHLDGAEGGLHGYGEIDDSYSFYRGLHPSHQLLEVSGDLAADGWALSADYMYYHSNGDVQTPGWNRLTQALIDRGQYVTGRSSSPADSDGNGRLTLNELGGDPYHYDPAFQPLYLACQGCTNPAHTLDSGYGVTHIDRRTIYLARGVDFSNTATHTGFLELTRPLEGGDTLKLEAFADTLANDRFVSYGFPGSYRTQIGEMRALYNFRRDGFAGRLTSQTVMGASWRLVHAVARESYNSGVIALDRRDISQGAAANDIIASPFAPATSGTVPLGWENDVRSNTGDAGLFVDSDIAWDHGADLTLGGRYDSYTVRSRDQGVLPYEPVQGRAGKGALTYTASLSYKSDLGLVPYVTNAKSSALEIGQASEVMTSLLAADDWLSTSFLNEAGLKFAFLQDHLVGSLAWYRQQRTQLQQGVGGVSVLGTRAKGGEAELRYVLDANFSVTLAASTQHTIAESPPGNFQYIPARTAGVSPQYGFGGSYVTFDFAALSGRAGSYEDRLVPHAVVSPYVTYTSDEGDWGGSFGGTYVSQTAQTVPDPLIFPAYVTFNLSAFLRRGGWEADMNIDNLADARYFTPDADTYANLGALPGVGRTWRITLKRDF